MKSFVVPPVLDCLKLYGRVIDTVLSSNSIIPVGSSQNGDRDRLIEVKIAVIKGSNFRDFEN